jgi:hypothetical protein
MAATRHSVPFLQPWVARRAEMPDRSLSVVRAVGERYCTMAVMAERLLPSIPVLVGVVQAGEMAPVRVAVAPQMLSLSTMGEAEAEAAMAVRLVLTPA